MQRVRVGIIGAGGIAQIEHVPNLLKLNRHFEITGVFDPSAKARNFMREQFRLSVFESLEDLLSVPMDAVVIASPDALHLEHILAAFQQGLHVFCEKPLCYAPTDIDRIIAARDQAGKVLQAGYMKRFDPSYEAALERLPGKAETLRYVSVEVSDPDAWPFIRHHAFVRGDDVADDVIQATRQKQKEQVARAVSMQLDDHAFRGFCNAYCSALVHDVNAVHGLLDAMDVPAGDIAGAQLFAAGDGGQGAVCLLGGQAMWNMVHLAVPALAEYRERITFYFDDASLELVFPSPWLNHHPTKLTIKHSEGHRLHCEDIHSGYEEAFVEELKGFWAAVVQGSKLRNSAEEARCDMALLCGLAQWHASHPVSGIQGGIR